MSTTTAGRGPSPPAYVDSVPYSSDTEASGGMSAGGNVNASSQMCFGSDNFAFDSKEQEAIGSIMSRHNPANDTTSPNPVIYVIRSPLGSEQISMAHGTQSTSAPGQFAGRPQIQAYNNNNDNSSFYRQSFIPHLTLACLVFWLFGIVFGLIAFILALVARRKAAQTWSPNDVGAKKQARDIGRASYIVSVVGIVVGCIVVLAVIIALTLDRSGTVCNGLFAANGKCFNYRSQSYSASSCGAITGSFYNSIDNYCYFNTSAGRTCPDNYYDADGSCYSFMSSTYTQSTCSNVGGHYSDSICYYNSFNCSTMFYVDGQCYRYVSTNYDQVQCESKGGYYDLFMCYYDNCGAGNAINNVCYDYTSTQYNRYSCDNVRGFFSRNTCYYSYNCPYYQINAQCYTTLTDTFTMGTCNNIGGYYVLADDGFTQYCYYNTFNCSQRSANGQCYSLTSSSLTSDDCDDIADSYYNASSRICYFNCMTMMTSSGTCYQYVSSTFTSQTCLTIGGFYQTSTRSCYYMTFNCTGPDRYPVGNQCYTAVSSNYTCSTCANMNGYFSPQGPGLCYYYQSSKCNGRTFNGQCYSNQSASYDRTYCVKTLSGSYSSAGLCYFTPIPNNCTGPTSRYINCVCYTRSSTVFTSDSCRNMNGYYENATCFYNSATCPYYSRNQQCYQSRSQTLTTTSCNNIGGYLVYELLTSSSTYVYVCYYNTFACSYLADDGQCYLYASTAYLPGTCTYIFGRYSYENNSCFYNTDTCSYYYMNGQCYAGYTYYYTAESCAVVGGYYTSGLCYYWFNCKYTYNSQCYRYMSNNFTCGSCRAVGGELSSWGACYYNGNCTFLLNGQCYSTNRTVSNSASCIALSNDSYFSTDDGQCYYNSWCSVGTYPVNCGCFLYKSTTYTRDTCNNINGSYAGSFCYYNSSFCGYPKYSLNDQCYSFYSQTASPATCSNIGGYYVYSTSSTTVPSIPSTSSTPGYYYTTTSGYSNVVGTCYYTSWNCLGYPYGSQCYKNMSLTFTSATCNNIGGYYTFDYVPAIGYYAVACYFNTFNCSRFVVNGQCHLFSSRTLTRDSCSNVNGYYNTTINTCYYSNQCYFYPVNGQCYSTSLTSYSCETCQRLLEGYYNLANSACYFSSIANCPYFTNGVCFQYLSQSMTYTQCAAMSESYWSDSGCYFNNITATMNCTTGYYYQRCNCYLRSSTFTSSTCSNIRGFYSNTENYCYYSSFNCSTGYSVNGQCYSWIASGMNDTWCSYYADSYYDSTSRTCFYSGVCRGYYFNGLCYAKAESMTCSSCVNVGGFYNYSGSLCYYYSSCPFYQINRECYSNRTFSVDATCSIPGAYYTDRYCYYSLPPTCTSGFYFSCNCYNSSSVDYSSNTCTNIGGYYYGSTCYYNTSSCPGYWFQSNCYRYRYYYNSGGNCSGSYDSSTGYCYYY